MQDQNDLNKDYSIREEIFNSISHGMGVLLSIAGLAVLIVMAVSRGTVWHVIGFAVFGSTLIILYLFSTLYHSFRSPRLKNLFARLDHAAIFILIAGTYTPFTLTTLRGSLGWTIFAVIWTLAIFGVVLRSIYLRRFRKLSVVLYVGMGWLVVFALREIFIHLPLQSFIFLLTGGLFYTIGVIFYAWRRLPFNHAIWHVFVLLGSIFHFFSVLQSLHS
ncbi:MAG: hemolysin III family protein [Caldithrix sp.]|nr:hemolysin III family protein [Caldithrix sp.]